MNESGVLKNIVRTGWVSSVNAEERTARVIFEDKVTTFVSGDLKVIQNQPLIIIEKWVDGDKWSCDAKYASADRSLGLDESYTKAVPDIIKSEKSIEYKCLLHGTDETKTHRETVKVYPWLPYVGQFVLCIYIPDGESDGFVIGGI